MPAPGKSKARARPVAAGSARGPRTPRASRPAGEATRPRAEFASEANELIASRLDQLIRNMCVLADGVLVESTRNAKVQTYSTPPDRAANIYLLDRLLGKAKDADEGPPTIAVASEVAEAAIAAGLRASGAEVVD